MDLSELSQDSFGSDTIATVDKQQHGTSLLNDVVMVTSKATSQQQPSLLSSVVKTTSSLTEIENTPKGFIPTTPNGGGSGGGIPKIAIKKDMSSGGVFALVSSPSQQKDTPSLRATVVVPHNIPRVVSSGDPGGEESSCGACSDQPVIPKLWSVQDVCQFLRVNDCASHCESFKRKVRGYTTGTRINKSHYSK